MEYGDDHVVMTNIGILDFSGLHKAVQCDVRRLQKGKFHFISFKTFFSCVVYISGKFHVISFKTFFLCVVYISIAFSPCAGNCAKEGSDKSSQAESDGQGLSS